MKLIISLGAAVIVAALLMGVVLQLRRPCDYCGGVTFRSGGDARECYRCGRICEP